tara:strand:+ start:123 stop:377 length:255 start_codon:yes stop_codon:yes gene_type:complete
MTTKKWDKEKLETLMTHIEKVVQDLEKGDQPLEDSLKAYEQGIQLIQVAQNKLQNMESRIEKIMEDGTTAPLNPSEMAAVSSES